MEKESNIKVYETNDYEKFKTLTGNRTTDVRRIRKIEDSIKNVGYIHNPIIVNEKFEVIDGQGRLEALKKLHMSVPYVVQEGIGVKECISMNINQTNWKHIDYIKSYVDIGNQSYIYLYDLIKKFPNISTLVVEYAVSETIRFDVSSLMDGKFECTEAQYLNAFNKLQYLENFNFLDYKNINGRNWCFLYALCFCYDCKKVDNKKLIEKVRTYSYMIDAFVSQLQCLQLLEKIYNMKTRSEYVYIETEYRMYIREKFRNNLEKANYKKMLKGKD